VRGFLILIVTAAFANFAMAAELRLVSADFDPYSFSDGKGSKGVMYEVVQEIARRVGQNNFIEFVPWARAQTIAKTQPNVGILPLARVPERESDYVWLLEILHDPYVFFAKKDTQFDISILEAVKNLRIGTFGGSLAEVLLQKKGFKNFKSVTTDLQNVLMLKANRIDVWVAPLSFKNRYKEKGGLGEDDLRVGATLIYLKEYLGASKNLDAVTIKKWRDAFQEMKKDGTYAALMKKYGFEPLK
jgi:polar amino acid transport system substrate-binding protein